jgi:putative heme transporter
MTDAVSPGVASARLDAWHVLRTALSVARAEPWRVFGVALIVFAPFAAVEAGTDLLAEHIRSESSHLEGLIAVALLPATTATIWGSALYAGGLERTIGAHHYGADRPDTLALLRGLPIGRLVAADLVLGAVVFTGYALFVLPGILAFTLFALVGPMVTIEERAVVDAFRRSASLVLERPWLVFSLVTLPVILEETILQELEEVLHARTAIAALIGAPIGASLLGAAIGLVEVTLAYELIRVEPHDAGAATNRRLIRHGVSALVGIVIVVATFAFILPRIADYGQVWHQIAALDWPQILALGAATLVSLLAFAPPMMAALPRLRFRQAFVVTQASAASSYVLPGGPAVGMATSFAMLRGWGFTAAAVTLAVAVTGVWLQFALLGFPAVGLALLAVTGGQQTGVESAGLLGLAVFGVVLAVFTGALSSARLAQWAGDLSARIVSRALALVRRAPVTWTGDSFVAFRTGALGLLRRRWHALTITTVAQQLALFGVLLVALRALGVPADQVSGVEAFAAWSLVRLLGALAITPGGIGVVELVLTSLLVGFGGARAGTVAAVLVYRVLTIAPTVALGLIAAATWRRHHPTAERSSPQATKA